MKRIVVVSASPRPEGNSRMLASALAEGGRSAGHIVDIIDLNDVMGGGLLRDCRTCRGPEGCCSIDDGFAELVHDYVLPADGIVYATPLYWYGMAAGLKNFFDRMVCYVSASYPRRDEVARGLVGKRSALLMSAEEAFATANLGVISQLQEISRYVRHEFVGVVLGVGNKRGEVRHDPAEPLAQARRLGERLFEIHHSDYWLEAERPNAVWAAARDEGRDREVSVYDDA